MTDMIRSFDELKAEQRLFAGGKGGTLAQLYQAGYPVPDGFVILPSTFAGNVLDPEAWSQAQAHVQKIRHLNSDPAFAIRSSALSEDSAQASFAGEFETVLDVRTNREIYDAIHTVHQSRQSERVQAYSQAQGMDPGHDVAVVVQQLVPAEISGVLFTACPSTSSKSSTDTCRTEAWVGAGCG